MQPYELTLLDPVSTGHTRIRPSFSLDSRIIPTLGRAGLGLDTSGLPTTDQIDVILNDATGGSENYAQTIDQFLSQFGIGAGRVEADIIVPVQNRLMYNLGLITDQIRIGQNPSLSTLQSLYATVRQQANNFIQFVLSAKFTDRRASGQALNTVMPYIDGTCGYAVPLGMTAIPGRFNCLSWGDGTVGGVGTNGMLGAIGRAITGLGGTVSGGIVTNPPTGTTGTTTMGISTPLLIGVGIVALFLFSKKGF